jgi:hypothetical protein
VAGAGRFRALARAFVRAHPPSSPVLARYGRGFPALVADSDLASLLPYLPDLARLELACLDALHAANAPPVDPDSLASALGRPETLPSLRLALHPSLASLCSPYAVVSLWAAHQEDGSAPALDPFAPESAWVLRRGRSLRVLPMSVGDCRFVGALQDGATLGDAAVFWKSGQTKVEGLAIDLVDGTVSPCRRPIVPSVTFLSGLPRRPGEAFFALTERRRSAVAIPPASSRSCAIIGASAPAGRPADSAGSIRRRTAMPRSIWSGSCPATGRCDAAGAGSAPGADGWEISAFPPRGTVWRRAWAPPSGADTRLEPIRHQGTPRCASI